MKIVLAEDQRLHDVSDGAWMGEPEPYFETPERIDRITASLADAGFDAPESAARFDIDAILRIHGTAYVEFLRTMWQQSRDAGESRESLFPSCYAPHGMDIRVPKSVDGLLGYYSFDTSAPITETSWRAAKASSDTVLTAQALVADGDDSAFALCRPPGHHAGANYCGGFCYLNNVAIAAQAFIDSGASRVAILDVDYHHGNGTQDIFYDRGDVLFVSIHAHPDSEFPYLMGYPDETGGGDGDGTNLNLAIRKEEGSSAKWLAALDEGLAAIQKFGAEVVLVSLGVDAFEKDPFGGLGLATADYDVIGQRIAALGRPTLFVMEGGYAMDGIGACVANTLTGFENR